MKNKKKIKKIISNLACIVIGYSMYPVIEQQIDYKQARQYYEQYREERNKYSDWITISNTKIDYPIAYGKGNDYYLYNDIEGNPTTSGSIFFEESQQPYDNTMSLIYGHSMRDGSMFNNLHKLKQNRDLFKSSILTLKHNDTIKEYKPLGIYVTNDDWFYKDLDNMNIEDAIKLIQEKCNYSFDVDINEDSHIITLYTCEYTKAGNRLLVFYI